MGVGSMREVAFVLLNKGRAEEALGMSEALLARDPKDSVALIIKARALRALGRMKPAREASQAAWSASKTPGEKYVAALTVAQVLASDGRRTRAQFWLRRAIELAPDQQTKAKAVRDFSYVRSRNPLSLSFSAAISPTSNVNNGSSARRLGIFELVGASRALSGTEASLGFSARYKLPPTGNSLTEFRIAANAQTYQLSSEAKAQAPTARGSDFAYSVVEAGVSNRRRLGPALLNVGATIGHNWYGGEDLSNYLRLESGLQWHLNDRTLLHGGISAERQIRLDGPNRSATNFGLTAGVVRKLPNSDSLGFSASLRNSSSPDVSVDHQSIGLTMDYRRAAPIAGIQLSGSIGLEARDFDQSIFTSDGRRDRRTSVTVSAVFARWDYMGFVPSLEFSASRNRSNISLYEKREAGMAFGIKSAF